jgi:hypothetical protein
LIHLQIFQFTISTKINILWLLSQATASQCCQNSCFSCHDLSSLLLFFPSFSYIGSQYLQPNLNKTPWITIMHRSDIPVNHNPVHPLPPTVNEQEWTRSHSGTTPHKY